MPQVYIPCMSPRNHADCVGNDCDAVLSGEIIAGRYVQLAVERHLDDLEHGLAGFFSSSDSTGGSACVDDVDEDGPWDETDPLFYEMYDDAMNF